MKRFPKTLLCIMLACALLLCGCTAAEQEAASLFDMGTTPLPAEPDTPGETDSMLVMMESNPEPTPLPVEDAPAAGQADIRPVLKVSDVNGLLKALGSGVIIELAPGEYDLAAASDYGSISPSSNTYYWEEVYDGYALAISCASDLTIRCAGGGASILSEASYADVIHFYSSENVTLEGLTLGHSVEPGTCAGDVLCLQNCSDMLFYDCRLFGCGVKGISCYDSSRVTAEKCSIYGCSVSAVSANFTEDLRLIDCDIYDNGVNSDWVEALLYANGCEGFAAVNCRFVNNVSMMLLDSCRSMEVYLLGCSFSGGSTECGAIRAEDYSPVIEGCSFDVPGGSYAYSEAGESLHAVDRAGKDLSAVEIGEMERREMTYGGPALSDPPLWDDIADGETLVAEVSTIDEFLDAIAPNRIILMRPGVYDISAASGYGVGLHDYWRWEERYDGAELVLCGVYNTKIIGLGDVSINAMPRYANVLGLDFCSDLIIDGISLGHFDAPGECAGGVICMETCDAVEIRDCYLYGCGTLGIDATYCSNIHLSGTEIANCSYGAVNLIYVSGYNMSNCYVHDCPEPLYTVYDSAEIYLDGAEVEYRSLN